MRDRAVPCPACPAAVKVRGRRVVRIRPAEHADDCALRLAIERAHPRAEATRRRELSVLLDSPATTWFAELRSAT